MWTAPPDAERAALLAQHAHRFPVPVPITVRGDRGEPVRLPFLLGNPTGILRPPPARVSPYLAQLIGAVNLGRNEDDDDEAIRDCVLYPPPAQLIAARNRWPGLVADLCKQILAKIGLQSAGAEVFAGEDVPPEIAAALTSHPRAACHRFTPPGADGKPVDLLVVIDTPGRVMHDAFNDAVTARDADRVKLARDFAEGVTVGVHGAASASDVFDRWPGVMLLVVGRAAKLAASVGSARLGEW